MSTSCSVAPSVPPQNLTGYAVDSTTITLSWLPIPDELQNGIIRHYVIRRTEADTGAIYEHISTSEMAVLSGVHPFYTHECEVAGVTNTLGPFSASIAIKTPEDG